MPWPRLDFIPVAGVLIEAISGVAGTLVVSTGFAAGAAFGALIVAFDLVLG